MIEVEDLRDLSKEDIIELIKKESQPIEFAVPKETVLYSSETEAIAIDYLHLAFIGERLSREAEKFEYSLVQPHESDVVVYEITTTKIEELAEALLDVSYGYVNDHEDGSYFPELVSEFEGQLDDKTAEFACSYFVEVYKEYLDESSGENIENQSLN